MITMLGNVVTKSRNFPTVVKTVPVSTTHRKVDDVQIDSFGGGNVTVDEGWETIVYTRGSKTNRQRANSCRHDRFRRTYMGDVSEFQRITQVIEPNYYRIYTQHAQDILYHAQAVTVAQDYFAVPLGTAYLGANAQDIINLAASEMKPDLTDVSIPNFIVELKDVRKMFDLWRKSISLAKNLAGAHLNYAFGWKPTVGDLKAALFGVVSLSERLAAFEDPFLGIQHRSKKVLDETVTHSGSFSPASNVKCYWRGTLTRKTTAHVAYRHLPIKVGVGLRRAILGHLDRLGFEINPALAWNALPFTFVVDWFLNVGSFLEQYKLDTLELPIQYVDSYVQYKEELRIESYITKGEDTLSIQGPMIRSGGSATASTFFNRMPIFPDYVTLRGIGWKLPSKRQTILLLTLALVLKDD